MLNREPGKETFKIIEKTETIIEKRQDPPAPTNPPSKDSSVQEKTTAPVSKMSKKKDSMQEEKRKTPTPLSVNQDDNQSDKSKEREQDNSEVKSAL